MLLNPFIVGQAGIGLADGLLHFWKFEDSLADAAGSADLVEGYSSCTFASGRVGRAALIVPNALLQKTSFTIPQVSSFAGFFKGSWTNAANGRITASTPQYDFPSYVNGDVRMRYAGAQIGSFHRTSEANWYHLAATVAADTAKFYVNGTLIGSAAITAAAATGTLYFFGPESGQGYYQPTYDEWGIWNRVLTAEEVALLAAGTSPV
jgi:hypothetical protein